MKVRISSRTVFCIALVDVTMLVVVVVVVGDSFSWCYH